MPEQVQQHDGEDTLSIASYSEKSLNIQGSGSGGCESTDSWSLVENSASEEEEESDEEEENEVEDQLRDEEDPYSTEEGSEQDNQDQDEGYEDHDDEESEVSDQSDESSSCSSISLEDESISSLNDSSTSLEDDSVPSLSDSNSSSEGEEDSSENGSELDVEPDVTNTNPAPSTAASNSSNIAVYTSSLKSETTSQAASANFAQVVPSSTTPIVGKEYMFFGSFKPRRNDWNLRGTAFPNFQSVKHPLSASSVQVAPSSTSPSEISSLVSPTSEVPDNQEEILQAAEKTREELYRKIKMATKPEEITVCASPPPQQEEDEAVKLWSEVGRKQFNALKNALLAAHVQAEFKQKVSKALESDVKKVEDLSMEEVQKSLLCKQREQQSPLVDIQKKAEEDLVSKRFCLVCSTGQVRIVAVNGGRNQRWQCVDCKEWYEWCPVVHPVSPKRARLLETGGWDDDYDQKQEKKQSAKKAQEQEESKPVIQQGDKKQENMDLTTQKEINIMTAVLPTKPEVVGQPVDTEQCSSGTVKPGFSSSKTLLFLLAAVWMVLVFALGCFAWKHSAEMQTSAKFLQEVQNLRKDLKEHIPTRHLEYIEYSEYITRVPHHGIPKAAVPSTFQAKLWLLLLTFFTSIKDNVTNLVSIIEAQLQHYNQLDVLLLLYSLAAVCGALLMALVKCANVVCKSVVIFLGIKSLLLFLTWLNGA